MFLSPVNGGMGGKPRFNYLPGMYNFKNVIPCPFKLKVAVHGLNNTIGRITLDKNAFPFLDGNKPFCAKGTQSFSYSSSANPELIAKFKLGRQFISCF